MRLYLDEDVRRMLAEILRQRGYDVVAAAEVRMIGKSDAEQLEYACRQRRAILTHNIKDFVRLDSEYEARGLTHCGIVVSDQIRLRELLRRVARLLSEQIDRDISDRLIWLHDYR